MEALVGIAFVLGFIVIIALMIYFINNKMHDKMKPQYETLAEKFGLNIIPEKKWSSLIVKFMQLEGFLGDFKCIIYDYTTGGKNKTTYTAIEIKITGEFPSFYIYNEGFFSKVFNILGMSEAIIGNKELDDLFYFRTRDEEFVTDIFQNEEIAKMMVYLHSHFKGHLKFEKSTLSYNEINYISTEEKRIRYEKVTTLLYAIAKEIKNNREINLQRIKI